MKRIALALSTLAVCLTPLTAYTQNEVLQNIPTVIIGLKSTIYLQKKIASCTDMPSVFKWGTSNVSLKNDAFTITGTDLTGRSYTAVKEVLSVVGCELWDADLTGAGKRSLILVANGDDSSGGYDSTLTVLTLDQNESLIPWQATGRFTTNDSGVQAIVSTPDSKGASILIETEEGLAGQDVSKAWGKYSFSKTGVAKIINEGGIKWPIMRNGNPILEAHRSASIMNVN